VNAPEGAAVLFVIHGDSVAISFGDANAIPFDLKPNWRSSRDGLNLMLLSFKDVVGDGRTVDCSVAYEALDLLYTKALSLANSLFRDFELLVHTMEERLRPRSAAQPLLVDIVGQDTEFLPLELLPFLHWNWRTEANTIEELVAVARTFLGFATIVRRTGPSGMSQSAVLARGRPPLRLFRHAAMSGAVAEEAYFRNSERFDFRGSWPDEASAPLNAATELSARCSEPATTRGISGDPPPDRIHHFACHFYVNTRNLAESRLSFAADGGTTRDVSVEDLARRLYMSRVESREPPGVDRPLVFVNACGSSTLSPDAAGSLPELFMRNGNVGFIGAETRVPDMFAADFARSFYEALLDGSTVGGALWWAKQQALSVACNPLGLLYAFYGNPDLHIQVEELAS
jgi:hypothetical protein